MPALPSWSPAEPIHLWVPGGERHSLAGCRLHHSPSGDADYPQGVPAIRQAWTLLDLAASLSYRSAVVVVEAVLNADPDIAIEVETLRANGLGRRPAARIAAVFGFAGSLSESPLESQARLVFAAADLPRPLQQATIRRRGRFLARVDFLWPEAMLIVEVDGLEKYGEPGALQREKERQNDLVAEGFVVLRFTWADIVHRSPMVVTRIAHALGL